MFDSNILTRKSGRANIRPSEGAGTTTLTTRDNPWQVFNLSAARTCVLPSTGVLAGDQIVLENVGAFDLTVQSSNGSSLIRTNNANIDATINNGRVFLEALVDAPTTPTNWRVVDVYETFVGSTTALSVNSGTGSIASTSGAWRWARNNNIVSLSTVCQFTVTGTVNAVATPNGALPTRIISTDDTTLRFGINGSTVLGTATGWIGLLITSAGAFSVANLSPTTPSSQIAFSTGVIAVNASATYTVPYRL